MKLSISDLAGDEAFMLQALSLAERAAAEDEVPVGAVLVIDGEVVGEGWNQPIALQDPTAHAEVLALRDAAARLGNYRLCDSTLYVTLEPCPMCAGAIVHARVARVVYAAADPKGGAAGSIFDLLPTDERFNHRVLVEGGVLQARSSEMLKAFFSPSAFTAKRGKANIVKAEKRCSCLCHGFLFTGLLGLTPLQAQNLSDMDLCLLKKLQQAEDGMSVGELKSACEASLTEQPLKLEPAVAEEPPVADESVIPAPFESGESLVSRRIEAEKATRFNPFVMSPHKRNYALLASYNASPNYEIYNIPASSFDRLEMKFQFSFKIPVVEGLFGSQADLYAAYSNLSFWQAYNRDISSPFRETNHEPEMFLVVPNDWEIFGWRNSLMQFGAVHQSNGQGGYLSRSWNRLYASFVFENRRFLLNFKPWYRVPEDNDDNPDIDQYMGHYELSGVYKKGEQTFGLVLRNLLDKDHRETLQLDWSFPLYKRWRGYIQYFNGYGESLVDYNHEGRRIGFGLQLTDWL